ncbi:unnamed protein product [Miscanthus lutarioriparius]|uniref:Uncharacterized protein n=1 Tax=Miscanthus lutarioriparius TaxID=422564 RepID=A0A811NEA8_9POAL|nr:unnamed protein product [Miscanthus lutarioriparius]
MASLEEERNRILNLESEEDRKILMKVKSEEGKILKLKEYAAAALAGLLPTTVPTVMAAQPAGKKTRKEPLLAMHPKSFQYSYRQDIRIRNTRLAYLDALIYQQEKFGYAVDESEAEVTDDEGEDDDT